MRGCSVPGCERKHYGKGYCNPHYQRVQNGVPLDAPPRERTKGFLCTTEGCGKPSVAKKLCGTCYAKRRSERLSKPCTVPGCGGKAHTKGLCEGHYSRKLTGKPVEAPLRARERTNTQADRKCFCGRQAYAKGMCQTHYTSRVWAPLNRDKVVASDHRRRARISQAGGSYTDADWQAVLEAYGHRCRNCAELTKLTVDHVVPIAKGGSNGIENIQPLCGRCNRKKGVHLWKYL